MELRNKNKRKTRLKKIISIHVIISIMIISLCSCGKKNTSLERDVENPDVNILNDDDATANNTGNDASFEETDSLKQEYNIPDFWKEEILTKDGESIHIGASISVMDATSMNVYSTRIKTYDTEEKKKILLAWSTDGVIYKGEEENMPKSYYDAKMSSLEQSMTEIVSNEQSNGMLEESYQDLAAKYERNKEKREQAPDDYIETVDYSQSLFVVKHDEKYWHVDFYENQKLYVSPVDEISENSILEVGDCVLAWGNELLTLKMSGGTLLTADEQEECKEIIRQADEYVSLLVPNGEFFACEIYEMPTKEPDINEPVEYSYELKYYRKLNGGYFGGMQSPAERRGFEYIDVKIGNDGELLMVLGNYQIDTPEIVAENVSLLDFEVIKESIIQGLKENPLTENQGVYRNYLKMALAYMFVKNPEDANEYMLVPAWLLVPNSSISNAVDGIYGVNAIDGSIIDTSEQFFGIE